MAAMLVQIPQDLGNHLVLLCAVRLLVEEDRGLRRMDADVCADVRFVSLGLQAVQYLGC